jgi:hypothetical protein
LLRHAEHLPKLFRRSYRRKANKASIFVNFSFAVSLLSANTWAAVAMRSSEIPFVKTRKIAMEGWSGVRQSRSLQRIGVGPLMK